MTDEQINRAIAEVCGWHDCFSAYGEIYGYPPGVDLLKGRAELVPDYCNDLNAMHEAEKVLTNERRFDFVYHLNDVLGLVPLDSPASYREPVLFAFANATAAQRAKAFLRTLGKWGNKL